jgi:diguanylate cyclase (GGDEF)-like protein/PAS domain S-box-containing protein
MTSDEEQVSAPDLWHAQDALVVESEFRLALEYSATAMCLSSPRGTFLHVNTALCEMLGRSQDELRSARWQELTHPDDLAHDLQQVAALAAGRIDRYRLTKRYLHADGGIVWGDLSVGVIRDDSGRPRSFVSQVVDMTARIEAEAALAARERLLRVVLDTAADAVICFDSDLRVEYVNRRIVEISGIAFDDWIGKTFREVGYPAQIADLWDSHHRRVFETGEPTRYEFEIENEHSAGRRFYETRAAPEVEPDGTITHIVTTSRDITDQKASERELLQLANHDPLTGLANRTALKDEMTRALAAGARSGRSTALLMVDLDRFKIVNDSLGHAVGDELLRIAAARLERTVRLSDLVARPGGDEFVIVMRDVEQPAEALGVAWRIVDAFREAFEVGDSEMYVTASVGVTVSSPTSKADDLIREADTALYVAKGEGRDRVSVFDEDLRAEGSNRLQLERELRHALDNDQLEVWYQPEINLATGAIVALEALLRWRHPDGVVRSAGQFIEIAEETGQILDIGDWVLNEACLRAAAWSHLPGGEHLIVRVNVSALQLAESGLLIAVDEALRSSAVDPSHICVEITETALLRETATTRENLTGLLDRGIRIAADDFGTGFASLSYLLRYPIDVLKIDRSFVDQITTNDQTRRLVAGIISLADALEITVTAEGVERPEQAAMLRSLSCPGAQGFLYSPAVPPDMVPLLLQQRCDPA